MPLIDELSCHCIGRAGLTINRSSALLARPKQCRARIRRELSAGQAVAHVGEWEAKKVVITLRRDDTIADTLTSLSEVSLDPLITRSVMATLSSG